MGVFPWRKVGREWFTNDLINREQHLSCIQIPSDNHVKSEYVGLDWNLQGTLADYPKRKKPATTPSLQTRLELLEQTESPSKFDFYDCAPELIQTASVQPA